MNKVFIQRIRLNATSTLGYNYDGVFKEFVFQPGVYISMIGQTSLNYSYMAMNQERFSDVLFKGVNRSVFMLETSPVKGVSASFSGSAGKYIRRTTVPELGRGYNLSTELSLEPVGATRLLLLGGVPPVGRLAPPVGLAEPRAHHQHEVCVVAHLVVERDERHRDRELGGLGQHAARGPAGGDRRVQQLGDAAQLCERAGVDHATARVDDRHLGRSQHFGGSLAGTTPETYDVTAGTLGFHGSLDTMSLAMFTDFFQFLF